MGTAEFAAGARFDFTAQDLTGQLHAVANPQRRDAEVEDGWIALGSARLINAGRAAGKDQPARAELGNARGREVVADDLAEDVLLPNPAGNQLAVLRTEVEDQDAFIFRQWRHAGLLLPRLEVSRPTTTRRAPQGSIRRELLRHCDSARCRCRRLQGTRSPSIPPGRR